MSEIVKIDDKNFKMVDLKETIYNLDELEAQLEQAIEDNNAQTIFNIKQAINDLD